MFEFFSQFKKGIFPDNENVSPKNWTKVRIWQAEDPQGNSSTPKKVIKDSIKYPQAPVGNVGHSSVHTSRFYASFWPWETLTSLKGPVPGFYNTLKQDERMEGGAATTETTLYSLDQKQMEMKYRELEGSSYALKSKVGKPDLSPKNEQLKTKQSYNCSTMAYQILKEGGINTLSPVCTRLSKIPSSMFAMTPDDLEECVLDAKRQELKRHPETEHFSPIPSSRLR